MEKLMRRALLLNVALEATALATACAGGAAQAAVPRSAPTQSVAEAVTTPSSWTAEWDGVIEAARAEGKLSLLTWGETWGGAGYPRVVEGFQQAFPGVVVERHSESSASVWLNKVRQGRRAGTDAFDLALVQPSSALLEGRPEGMWAPLKPLLLRPDVLDDSAWRDGLHFRFLDQDGDLCFSWEYLVIHAYAINTDLVPEGEIRTVEDLLHPRWRGKIVSSDPRLGLGLNSAAGVAMSRGTEVLKQLLVDQRPAIRTQARQLVEAIVRGTHPIALGVRPKALQPFLDQGLGGQVRYLDLPEADFAVTTAMLYFDRAPHPAAARLFANWILTQEGQTILTSSLPTNSARTDVPAFEPQGVGTAGGAYYEPDREASYQHTANTQQLIQRLLGRA
jgi:iron(III) transport system substrate-binding protein